MGDGMGVDKGLEIDKFKMGLQSCLIVIRCDTIRCGVAFGKMGAD